MLRFFDCISRSSMLGMSSRKTLYFDSKVLDSFRRLKLVAHWLLDCPTRTKLVAGRRTRSHLAPPRSVEIVRIHEKRQSSNLPHGFLRTFDFSSRRKAWDLITIPADIALPWTNAWVYTPEHTDPFLSSPYRYPVSILLSKTQERKKKGRRLTFYQPTKHEGIRTSLAASNPLGSD